MYASNHNAGSAKALFQAGEKAADLSLTDINGIREKQDRPTTMIRRNGPDRRRSRQ